VQKRAPDAEVSSSAPNAGWRRKIVPREGYRLELIDQVASKRTGVLQLIKGVFMLPRSILQSLRLVRRERPSVAVSVGGYAAAGDLAAWLSARTDHRHGAKRGAGRPTAARQSWRRKPFRRTNVRAPTLARNHSRRHSRGPQIAAALSSSVAHTQPAILVFAVPGRAAINDVVVRCAPQWVKRGWKVVPIGATDFASVSAQYAGSGVDARNSFTHGCEYQAADVVICRAGASSLANGAGRKTRVLIPLPTATASPEQRMPRPSSMPAPACCFRS